MSADRCEHLNYRGDCVHCERAKVEKLTARLAEAEAERDKYQKLNDIRWKESVMMTSEIGSLERRIAASELRCEKFQSQQAICQCGEPFSSHSEGSSCGMAVENQPPCPCQQRLAEVERERHKAVELGFHAVASGNKIANERDQLRARLAAAEAAATRWKWVRDNADIVGESQEGVYVWQFEAPDVSPDSIEADVDAAIEAEKGGE